MKSETKYFSEGTIIADSHEQAKGLMVITSGFVNAELPLDSEDAVEENSKSDGRTLLFVFGRGWVLILLVQIQKNWNKAMQTHW